MVIDAKRVTLVIRDGTTPTPKQITVKLGEGNFTYSEKKPRNYIKDRGKLSTVRDGDEEPVDVSLDSMWENLTTQGITGAAPTVEDVLKRRGPASDWVSTSADPCEPYAVDIQAIVDPDCAEVQREIITLPDFRYETADHDLRAGTLRFSGKSHAVEANVVREAQTA